MKILVVEFNYLGDLLMSSLRLRVVLAALLMVGCDSPRTIPVGQSSGGSERIYHPIPDTVRLQGFSREFEWHVEGEEAVVYGRVGVNWCASNGVFSYDVTVDSVVIR